jgi:glycosyltransferase involved in cell wall biosynthesis
VRTLTAVERWSVRFADRAVAVHRPHLERLVRHGNPEEKFEIVMNVPDRRFSFRPREGAGSGLKLIYHGTVGPRHGLDVAVRALALAREQVPELELRIVGGGDDFARVRQLVSELQLEEAVRLDEGFFPIEQVIPRIREADVGIAPILDDPFTRFMLPVKALEYMALGLPVIASATPTIRSYFDVDMIAFAAPGDPEDLAARMIELHRDPERRARLVAAARRFNEEHSWERERSTYFELVDSLLPSAERHRTRSAEPAAETAPPVGVGPR